MAMPIANKGFGLFITVKGRQDFYQLGKYVGTRV